MSELKQEHQQPKKTYTTKMASGCCSRTQPISIPPPPPLKSSHSKSISNFTFQIAPSSSSNNFSHTCPGICLPTIHTPPQHFHWHFVVDLHTQHHNKNIIHSIQVCTWIPLHHFWNNICLFDIVSTQLYLTPIVPNVVLNIWEQLFTFWISHQNFQHECISSFVSAHIIKVCHCTEIQHCMEGYIYS